MDPESEVEAGEDPWRPRWWLFGVFAVIAAVHLAGGWDRTATIGLPLGLAATLVLVFVRRLPPWVTGDWDPKPWSRAWLRARRNRLTFALPFLALGAAAVVAGLADPPPHGVDVLYAVFVGACFAGLVAFVLARWARTVRTLRLLAGSRTALRADVLQLDPFDDVAPVCGTVTFPDGSRGSFTLRDCPVALAIAIERTGALCVTSPRPGKVLAGLVGSDEFARATLTAEHSAPAWNSRAAVTKHLRLRTLALVAVTLSGVALEITVAITGGALPWVLPVPVLIAVLATAHWRSRVATAVRLLAGGPWTAVAAATDGTRPAGWAYFPTGIRARFHLSQCPPAIAAELHGRRRLWIAGEPREGEVAVGLPDADAFAVAVFAVKAREHRRARGRRRRSPD